MSGQTATDGQDLGQGDTTPEAGTAGGDTAGGDSKADRFSAMEARFEMLNESLSELRTAILARQGQAVPAQVEEIDDDEPLTTGKVKKIVSQAVGSATQATQTLSERQQWDNKAKADFPLVDPEFQLAVRKEWREQLASGLNGNHPKALYNVAQIVARTWKGKKQPKADAETTHTSEAPSTQRPASAQSGRRTPTVSDDDPRIRFYAMKGNKTKDQIEAQKRKLAELDAAKGARR